MVETFVVLNSYDTPLELKLKRCPHCRIAHPRLQLLWWSERRFERPDRKEGRTWGVFQCGTCGGLTTVRSHLGSDSLKHLDGVYPSIPGVDADLPDRAKRYLEQANDTLHAPDAAAMLAGSAVDAMLKARGYEKGGVFERINKAAEDRIITDEMAKWAHHVRLEANKPRHADIEDPHVTEKEAQAAVDFARAFGDFLFVFTARVERGIAENSVQSEPD